MKKLKLSKYYFAGGYGSTFSPEEYLKIGFDIACIGESDLIIRSLINYFSGKPKKENIKSICYLENNKIKFNKKSWISNSAFFIWFSFSKNKYFIKSEICGIIYKKLKWKGEYFEKK